jgi:high affinity Mn2+ porin
MTAKRVRAMGAALLLPWLQAQAPASDASAAMESDSDTATQNWALHGQFTHVWQYHPAFHSPYRGAQSLDPGSRGEETFDATLYAGVRPWSGGEFWIDPEIDQGFGLSDTLGVAGFPSGEAYKVGKSSPYVRLQRAFLRQTFDLGGGDDPASPDLNQLAGPQQKNRVVVTAGKFAVTDIFDTNAYAHDPRGDFLNWAILDTGTFDYAADAWGYTVGAAAEWVQDWWTLRLGLFDLSKVPNSASLENTVGRQFQAIAEDEARYVISGAPGKIKLFAFLTRGRMGAYEDALREAAAAGTPADIALSRDLRNRGGFGVNLEQQVTEDWGLFLRAGHDEGNREPFEFADIDDTLAGGAAFSGRSWGRGNDRIGLAAVINSISREHEAYLNAGGLGILVGDGRLPHPGAEKIAETYYDIALPARTNLTLDYQFVANPAYNRDRGPVSVLAARLHGQF